MNYHVVVLMTVVNAHVGSYSPVVIVPGAPGSQIEAKLLEKPSKPAWYCYSTTKYWFTLWLDIPSLLPFRINCWIDNVRLEWNMTDMTVGNTPGVYTRVPGFGDTRTMESLDTTGFVTYMKPLVEHLRGLGYRNGENLYGAPYDFRYSPESIPGDFYSKLESLVREAYEKNNSSKVSIISHSYGSAVAQYFLAQLSKGWKQKYINQWISLSGTFGGSKEEVLVYSSGFTEDIPQVLVDKKKVRTELRSCTSSLWMLSSLSNWHKNDVIVNTRKRTYRISDMDDFLKDIGYPQGAVMRYHISNSSSLMSKGPGVPTHCFHGDIPQSTISQLEFDGDFPDKPSKIIKGSGDGTVNSESLNLCKKFSSLQRERVEVREFKGVTHMGMLADAFVFGEITKLL